MSFRKYLKEPNTFIKKLKKFLTMPEHVIVYGAENSGKYTQALHIIEQFSPSKLNYSRKIELDINGEKYYFNISDIHFEIDFELLGTNESSIWAEYIIAIHAILDAKQYGILLCKNVHCMKDELLNIFHTFMREPKLKVILCTKHVSYIPLNIKEKCIIYNLKQLPNIDSYSYQYRTYCKQIIDFIYTQNNDMFLLRELIYSLLTYNFDIHTCLKYIHFELIRKNYIEPCYLPSSFKNILEILHHYNTNYRPIYHLELFVLDLHALRQCPLINNNVSEVSTKNPIIENAYNTYSNGVLFSIP